MFNIDSFRTNLMKTSIFTQNQAIILSIVVILIEILIVLALLFYKKLGLFIFLVTILFFTIYISFLRFNGLYEVCGCGGILNGLDYKYHFLINVLLIISASYTLYVFNTLKNEK